MIRRPPPLISAPHRLLAVLAWLAVALGVLVPQGYMATPSADGHGVSIVVCTGHGPLRLGGADDHRAHKPSGSAACPFAATLTPPLPLSPTLIAASATFAPAPAIVALDQTPGRGLAAPPPPSHAPPALPA